jgi:hypothetical protein
MQRVLGLFPALEVWGSRGHAAGILNDMNMCRYTCFNQRARVSLRCDTYALLVDGCLILLRMQCRQHICVPRIDHVRKARETNDYQQYDRE